MRDKNVQMSLSDIYSDVVEAMDEQRPKLIQLLDDHIDFDSLIPVRFTLAFYTGQGRGHIYHLESFIRAFTTGNAFIPTLIRISGFIPASPEKRSIGTISITTES